MANHVIRNLPFLQNPPKSKHQRDNYSTTSQTQQDDFNKEIFKQNLEGTAITLFFIIIVLLCVAIYDTSRKIK